MMNDYTEDIILVAKAMNDLADDWHWVVLGSALPLPEPRHYLAMTVRTICGVTISSEPRVIFAMDMGAPPEPTCPKCLDTGVGTAGRVLEAVTA